MSATAAGFAGMGATLGTVLLAVGALWALGLLKIGRSARRNNRGHEADVASDTLSARSGGSTKKF